MINLSRIVASVLMVFASLSLPAQTLDNFTLTNALDGAQVSLQDYGQKTGVVIIFTVNNCAFDEHYATRIKTLNTPSIPVLLVNSDASQSAETMRAYAQRMRFDMPYLADKDKLLMKKLGARKSTEAFLLKNNKGVFTVVYRGAIDDNPQMPADVRNAYLHRAIDNMLANRPIDAATIRATGCNIN